MSKSLTEERGIDQPEPAEEKEPHLTEPQVIGCVFVTGCKVGADDYTVRILGWTLHPGTWGSEAERRIAVDFAMPMPAARALKTELNRVLKAGH